MADFFNFYQLASSGGSPVTSGKEPTSVEYFTSGDTDTPGVDDNGNAVTFEAATMSRGNIRESGKLSDQNLDITFTTNNEFAKSRMLRQYDKRWWLDIADGPDLTTDNIFWRGVFRRAAPTGNRIKLTFVAAIGALDIYGLPWIFQRTCRHRLYDQRTCRADPTLRQFTYEITDIDAAKSEIRVTTTATVKTTPWMKGGTLYQGGRAFTIYGTRENNSVLQLNNFSNLKIGPCQIYEGCDKSYWTCLNVFNNTINFGGFADLPHSSLWGEDIARHQARST